MPINPHNIIYLLQKHYSASTSESPISIEDQQLFKQIISLIDTASADNLNNEIETYDELVFDELANFEDNEDTETDYDDDEPSDEEWTLSQTPKINF